MNRFRQFLQKAGKREFSSAKRLLLLTVVLAFIASCTPVYEDPDDEPEKPVVDNIYEAFEMTIQVEGSASIVSKDPADYLNCTISINGKGVVDSYQGAALIRGRGNSSWLWYDKKPYRIKLNESAAILGLEKNRDWVLLANYRDPTDLMNTFGFEVADWLGLPYTNHTRYVEVTLNGNYIGLYQLTEQVEQGGNRVNVDEIDGVLLCLDADDGPYYSPDAGDNFWSAVFEVPVCIKYPEIPTADQLYEIKNDFAKLENAIKEHIYDSVAALLDINSFIDYMIVQELVYNVEVDAPRSVFIHKDKGGKYVMGPVWDFDAGFDFDWGTMYTGHNFFNAQELVLGTDPVNHTGGYRVSDFFTDLFRNGQFVQEYKARWNEVKDNIYTQPWVVMDKYIAGLDDAMARDYQRWPVDKKYTNEFPRMKGWLIQRVTYLTGVINAYPEGTVATTKTDCGSITCDVTLSYALGYNQTVTVNIDQTSLLSKLGITSEQLYSSGMKIVPLMTNASEGINNTNGKFGAWFGSDNNPGFWANGHIYIEIDNNYTQWSCGLRADNGYCSAGEQHQVRMQYQYTQGVETKTVTVIINFTVGA